MPAERFYIDAPLTGHLTLDGPELHHLAHVMRIRTGEEIELVNGRGSLAIAKVVAIAKHEATLQVLSASQSPVPEPRILLAIPLMRPSKLEFVIEKCTELGADAFYLYPAAHSEKEDLSPHQLERLHHIAIAAMKQCGRLDLPPIHNTEWDQLFQIPAPLFFGDTRPNAQRLSAERGLIITGPERGFSEKELMQLEQKGTGVTLHRNILRAETAPMVAAILLQQT